MINWNHLGLSHIRAVHLRTSHITQTLTLTAVSNLSLLTSAPCRLSAGGVQSLSAVFCQVSVRLWVFLCKRSPNIHNAFQLFYASTCWNAIRNFHFLLTDFLFSFSHTILWFVSLCWRTFLYFAFAVCALLCAFHSHWSLASTAVSR